MIDIWFFPLCCGAGRALHALLPCQAEKQDILFLLLGKAYASPQERLPPGGSSPI